MASCWRSQAMKMWTLTMGILLGMFIVGPPSTHATISIPWGPFIIPRSGRSAPMLDSDSWKTHPVLDCCPIGINMEWANNRYGNTRPVFYCPKGLMCCDGLEQVVGEFSDKRPYSACIPRNTQIRFNDPWTRLLEQLYTDKKRRK